MTTTDANNIIRYESTDPVTPLESVLNAGLDSVSAAVTLVKRGLINYVANVTERTALAATFLPTATKPLYVHRGDAPAGLNLEWSINGTTWESVADTPELWGYQVAGTNPTGISTPGANVPDVGAVGRVTTRTGRIAFATTTSFGNEYAPVVTFSSPFPTAVLNVNITQIHTSGFTAYAGAVALDVADANSFRVLYPGGSVATNRAFLWEATGY